MSDYGELIEVAKVPRTGALVVAAAVSDTELVLDDAGDFDPDGGTLELNGVQLEYTGIVWGSTEDDEDTLTLANGLANAADVDDQVAPVIGGLAAEDWYAVVDMGIGDPVQVPLTYAQRALWPEGQYDPAVPVAVAEDLSRIEDAPGRPPASSSGRVKFLNTDTAIAVGSGDITVTLTYEPIVGSEHVYWNGIAQAPTEWSRSGNVVTIPDPDDLFEADDEFVVAYAYDGAAAQIEQPPLDADDDFAEAVLAVGDPILWADLGDASNLVTRDISGHSRDGAYVGTVSVGQPALAPGLPGTSVLLAGAGSAEWATAESWQRPPVFSAMIWAKPTSDAFDMFLIGADDLGSADPTRCWNITDDTAARVYSGSNIYPADGAAAMGRLTSGVTSMVFCTFDGTTLKFYVGNGDTNTFSLVQTTTAATMNTSLAYPLSIGASANGRVGRFAHFLGSLQHAVMWDVVATQAQAQAIWEAGTGA